MNQCSLTNCAFAERFRGIPSGALQCWSGRTQCYKILHKNRLLQSIYLYRYFLKLKLPFRIVSKPCFTVALHKCRAVERTLLS